MFKLKNWIKHMRSNQSFAISYSAQQTSTRKNLFVGAGLNAVQVNFNNISFNWTHSMRYSKKTSEQVQ